MRWSTVGRAVSALVVVVRIGYLLSEGRTGVFGADARSGCDCGDRMDLKHEIEKDIKRYSSILEKYKSGKLETGDLEGQDHLLDKTTDVSRHLENIIRELQALLRDG